MKPGRHAIGVLQVRTVPRLAALAAALMLIGAGALSRAAAPPAVPPGDVAVVAAVPITKGTWDHWMYVGAKGEATPGRPVIVPTDPPAFTACVAQVRRRIRNLRSAPAATIVGDCRTLFGALNGSVLDYLIKAHWYFDEAARLHIVPTHAQLTAYLNKEKAAQFPTRAAYLRFLHETGQTPADIAFRTRASLSYTRLVRVEHGAVNVDRIAAAHWKGKTACAALYTIPDCG